MSPLLVTVPVRVRPARVPAEISDDFDVADPRLKRRAFVPSLCRSSLCFSALSPRLCRIAFFPVALFPSCPSADFFPCLLSRIFFVSFLHILVEGVRPVARLSSVKPPLSLPMPLIALRQELFFPPQSCPTRDPPSYLLLFVLIAATRRLEFNEPPSFRSRLRLGQFPMSSTKLPPGLLRSPHTSFVFLGLFRSFLIEAPCRCRQGFAFGLLRYISRYPCPFRFDLNDRQVSSLTKKTCQGLGLLRKWSPECPSNSPPPSHLSISRSVCLTVLNPRSGSFSSFFPVEAYTGDWCSALFALAYC